MTSWNSTDKQVTQSLRDMHAVNFLPCSGSLHCLKALRLCFYCCWDEVAGSTNAAGIYPVVPTVDQLCRMPQQAAYARWRST